MESKETIIDETTLYVGQVLRLTRATVRLANGQTAPREIVHTTGAAGVLALNAAGAALFVRQWRTPLQRLTVEIPAGKIEPGEAPLTAAQRELNEEGGLQAAAWQPLGQYFQAAGFSDAQTHLYVAQQLRTPAKQRPLDDGEFLRAEWLRLPQAQALQKQGLICDAKTLLALAWWAQHGGEGHA